MTEREKAKYQEILEKVDGDQQSATTLFMRWKCLTDLYYLGAKVLGLEKATEGGRPRLDPVFHRWVASKMQTNKDLLMLVPRGHMKSTWAKVKVVQLVLQKPNIRIGLFSRTSSLVEEQLNDIKVYFQNPTLRQLFPDMVPPPGKKYSGWYRCSANKLTLKRDPSWGRIPQENQIEAWGAGATITGRHYDVIILDDIINELSCSTPDQIGKVRDWYSYMQSIKDPEGFELIVGTRYHFADIYGEIIKNRWFGSRAFVRKAIEDDKPIYSFFTKAMLDKIRRRQGPYEYSCQYDNNPIPAETQIFPPPYPMFEILPADEYETYVTVDPAPTVHDYSDETAIVVCSVNRAGILYVRSAIGYRKPPNEVAELVVSTAAKYQAKIVGVEFGLQQALDPLIRMKIADYERESGKRLNITIEAVKIPRHISKADRVNRTLGAFVRESKIMISDKLKDLMLQMEFFPKGTHDDLVDALAMQMQTIKRFRSRYYDEATKKKGGKTFFDLFKKPTRQGWREQFVA